MKRIAVYILLSLLFCVFLQFNCGYDFLYAEQFRLFRFSSDYAVLFFPHIGGPIGYLSSFLLQFYCLPWVGSVCTSLIFFLTAYGMDIALRRMAPGLPLPFFGITIGIMQAAIATEVFFSLSQNVAHVFCIWTLVMIFYARQYRYVVAPVALLMLFYLVGIYALVAALLLIVVSLIKKEWKTLYMLSICMVFVIMTVCLFFISDKDVLHVWTMDFYYFSFLHASHHSYWTLGLFVAGVFVGIVLRNYNFIRWRKTIVALQIITAVVVGCWYFFLCHNSASAEIKKLEVWRWNQQWDKILSENLPTNQNPFYANYQNLALAAQGKLGAEIMNYGQCGPTGLQMIWQGLQQESDLLSDIFLQEGHVAMSQKMAFISMQYNPELMHGRLMLRLIETNIILGEYATAEKYIKLLDETLFYHKKADSYKKYLYHPELVAKDKRLGALQKCTRGCDWCENDFEKSMKPILRANPSYKNAFEYLGSFYLLSNNLNGFRQFLDDYYKCPGLTPLPESFQKAADYIHWTKPTEK